MNALHYLTQAQLARCCQQRSGEQRLSAQLRFPEATLSLAENLALHAAHGGKFVILGIPEDLGPRANGGFAGAQLGFQAFLNKFLNLQANALLAGESILILGEVACADLQAQSTALDHQQPEHLSQLRALCAQLDERVFSAVQPIFAQGLTPIVIGGGHNNALPLLRALSDCQQQQVNCINLDPHADFRALEGRHSGNAFSYAQAEALLQHYFVLGLHVQKNNAASLTALQQANFEYLSYQQIFVEGQYNWSQAIELSLQRVLSANTKLALEVDTDCITSMPASALNYSGISVAEAEQAVFHFAKLPQTAYLHLAEAAPAQHPSGEVAGMNQCGQVLSQLVQAFLAGKQQQPPSID
ncbi:formimidoylglutamase [Alishewanella sp. SMS8]|uniref:formimidoylglutamase n=1 Tax=Alishewanella sp. SMS8 TaxID=2994676 RepID=UPI0027425922|nr:formimidoylglutamase [Alishewanella sp. SMS8]MDP5459541.1 formimidoylglutamase [Alishewanella sp. SMS8]